MEKRLKSRCLEKQLLFVTRTNESDKRCVIVWSDGSERLDMRFLTCVSKSHHLKNIQIPSSHPSHL